MKVTNAQPWPTEKQTHTGRVQTDTQSRHCHLPSTPTINLLDRISNATPKTSTSKAFSKKSAEKKYQWSYNVDVFSDICCKMMNFWEIYQVDID